MATPVRTPSVAPDSGNTPKAKAKNGRSVKVEVAPKASLQQPPPPTSMTPIKSPDPKRPKSTAPLPPAAGGDTAVRRSLQFEEGAEDLATSGTGNGIVPWLKKRILHHDCTWNGMI